ncbi:MAG: N(4)-(beta-N-acetylglucosaminyl)-L-asparaginase [Planctomycetota bacterium]|jgi:N4-(beta-N-acetylglucosaminyl)-L-asparaginase
MTITRRSFLAAGGAALPALAAASAAPAPRRPEGGPVAISSGNGLPAVTEAVRRMRAGADPADAVVAGVSLVEDDPDDMSVGYGGLPNERGVVELDASVMHGPTHKAGAVAALRNIRNPSQVALRVLRRTDHVLLVGDGALEFARAHGFAEQDLLTDKARAAWLRWKENLAPNDDWLDEDQHVAPPPTAADPPPDASGRGPGGRPGEPLTWGTIHCGAVDAAGDVAGCTTTSGLSFKLPGRVGDSPIVGAGMYVENDVGVAGATGRGEAVIQSCGAFQVVQALSRGLEPTEACLEVLRWIARHTRRPELLDDRGEPDFNVVFYALRRDGAYGSAAMRGRRTFAVHDGTEARTEVCAAAFE